MKTVATQFSAKISRIIWGNILNIPVACVKPSPTLSDNETIIIIHIDCPGFLCEEHRNFEIICRYARNSNATRFCCQYLRDLNIIKAALELRPAHKTWPEYCQGNV